MRFKEGVRMTGIKPEVVTAMMAVNEVYKSYDKILTITSVTDGKHRSGSLHYVGYAFDTRIYIFENSELESVFKDIKEALTEEFDVVLEKDHFHIEFQPKEGF